MGCDIHALIERHNTGNIPEWFNSGDPDFGRDYEMFAVLAGVRNYDGITPVSEPRGLPGFIEWQNEGREAWIKWAGYDERPCHEMVEMAERMGVDGYSHSWLSLTDIKAYDVNREIEDRAFVLGRDNAGNVTSTARGGSVFTAQSERVGPRKLFQGFGESEPLRWLRLIRYMEQARWDSQSDDEIRLSFFFDN